MSPTITDLLALHDLDLGALAHKVGVTGENFTTAHVDTLCRVFTTSPDECFSRVNRLLYAQGDRPTAERARETATLGAKVRVALSQPTIAAEPPPTKTRPQPGDVVPWAEVEDGSLYAKEWGCRFVMAMREWTANGNKPAALAEPSATASPKVPSDEAQRIAELEAEVARLSSWEQSLPCCSALSATPAPWRSPCSTSPSSSP